jgi:hypothetical protein
VSGHRVSVIDATSLEQANAALGALGVRTELDLEIEAAGSDAGR